MRICMWNNLFPPLESGSSHHAGKLATMMTERGHQVTVIAAQVPGLAAHERNGNVDIHRLPCVMLPKLELAHNLKHLSFTLLPGNFRWLSAFFREQKFDLFHQHGQIFDLALVSAYFARRLKLPLVNTIHTPVYHTGKIYGRLLPLLDTTFARLAVVNKADLLIAPDQTIVDYIEERYRHPRVTLIPYGIDKLTLDHAAGAKIRQRLGLGQAPVILSLGHVHNLRDRCDLIAAMPTVLARVPDARLLIVGDIYTQKPVELTAKLGLESKVIFTGRVKHSEVGGYLAAANIEAHWLNTSMGLGIAAMEAMLAGVPVISSYDENGLGRGLLEQGKHLYFVDRSSSETIAAPIIELLLSPDKQRRMGEAGKKIIEANCSWPAVTAQVEAAYQELIASA